MKSVFQTTLQRVQLLGFFQLSKSCPTQLRLLQYCGQYKIITTLVPEVTILFHARTTFVTLKS